MVVVTVEAVVVEVTNWKTGVAGQLPSALGSTHSSRPLILAKQRPAVSREQFTNGNCSISVVDGASVSVVLAGVDVLSAGKVALTGLPLMQVSKKLLHVDNFSSEWGTSNPAQTPRTLCTHGPNEDPRQKSGSQSPFPMVVTVDVTVEVNVVVIVLVPVDIWVRVPVDVTELVTVEVKCSSKPAGHIWFTSSTYATHTCISVLTQGPTEPNRQFSSSILEGSAVVRSCVLVVNP
jgi:hypothetical protein